MAVCEFVDTCAFFTHEVGYSPELWEEMKAIYCYGDNSTCARLAAWGRLPIEMIPDDLMPSETERAREMIQAAEEAHVPPAAPGTQRL